MIVYDYDDLYISSFFDLRAHHLQDGSRLRVSEVCDDDYESHENLDDRPEEEKVGFILII